MDAARQEALRSWLAFLRVPGLGSVNGRQLLDRFGSPSSVLGASRSALRGAGASAPLCAALAEPDWAGADADLRWMEAPHRGLISFEDPRYPPRLREIAQAPLALFYR